MSHERATHCKACHRLGPRLGQVSGGVSLFILDLENERALLYVIFNYHSLPGHHSCSSASQSAQPVTLRTSHIVYHMLSSPIQRITIKHPGYSGSNTILTLSACDGTTGGGRVHCATTLNACAITANNCSGGWLSSLRNGQQRVYPDADGLVPLFPRGCRTRLPPLPYGAQLPLLELPA